MITQIYKRCAFFRVQRQCVERDVSRQRNSLIFKSRNFHYEYSRIYSVKCKVAPHSFAFFWFYFICNYCQESFCFAINNYVCLIMFVHLNIFPISKYSSFKMLPRLVAKQCASWDNFVGGEGLQNSWVFVTGSLYQKVWETSEKGPLILTKNAITINHNARIT
jgi:hypothetical protein